MKKEVEKVERSGEKMWIRNRGRGIRKCGAGAPRAPQMGLKMFLNFENMKI
jgi:hypothetical protein